MRRFFLLLALTLTVAFVPLFGQPPGASPGARPAGQSFEDLVKAARKAQQDGLLPDAERLFREGLALKPDWLEGWAGLGTILFDTNRASEATEAFRHLTEQQPNNPEGWAFLGLSQYRARQYDEALVSLTRALTMGMRSTSKLASLAKIEAAFLLNRRGRFEESLALLSEQARLDAFNRSVEQAFGIALLRLPYLPDEVPDQYRNTIIIAGKAAVLASVDKLDEARPIFEQLVRDYPDIPQVHYCYGVFLTKVDAKAAIEQFKEELAITPDHLAAHLRLAMALWTEGQVEEAQGYAERAIALNSRSAAALTLLGRILLSEGQVEASIPKLEGAYRIAPGSSEVLLALQRAYSRAGRDEDAARIRQAFMELQKAKQGASASGPGLP